MKFLNRERQTGKTSILISTAYVMNLPIVVDTIKAKSIIEDTAKRMACDVKVYTADEVRDNHINLDKVLIDESKHLIEKALNYYLQTEVVAASMSIDIDKMPR